jgi:hypothetical protein
VKLLSYGREALLLVLALVLVRGCQLRDHEIDARATAEWRERSADSVLAVYKDSLAYANKVLAVRVTMVERWHVDTLWRSDTLWRDGAPYIVVPAPKADSIVHEQAACDELKGTCALLQRSSLNTITALRDELAAERAKPPRSCLAANGISAALGAAGALWLSRR